MKRLLIVIFCCFMAACAPFEKIVVVEKNNYIPVTTSKELFTKFELPALVDKKTWMSSSKDEQRLILLNMVADRDAIVSQCNARLFTIEKDMNDIVKIVEERNKKEQEKNGK